MALIPGITNENHNDMVYFASENQMQSNILNEPNHEVREIIDEQSIQRLLENGPLSEDSIIAIVQNDDGEPQTVMLTREEAEAFGIQLDPVEPSVQSEAEEKGFTGYCSEENQVVSSHCLSSDDLQKTSPPYETISSLPVNNKEEQATVSHNSVPDDGKEGKPKDILANIIQSLFDPSEPEHKNISITPRMVGGKRKLCLRLPASTASALLTQTGSPHAAAFQEGGALKKIKIVIPPSPAASETPSATEWKATETLTYGEKSLKVKQEAKSAVVSSKPMSTPLFENTGGSVNPAAPSTTCRNPGERLPGNTTSIQLVKEGNKFRSLQPLTPGQLQHITSILNQHRQTVVAGHGTDGNIEGDGKERIIYDAASNTRIVYRVMTPSELKKSSPSVNIPPRPPGAATTVHGPRKRGRPRRIDTKATQDITTPPSPDDTGKPNSTTYRGLTCHFEQFPDHGSNGGKPHHTLTKSDAVIEKAKDNHDKNDVTARSQGVCRRGRGRPRVRGIGRPGLDSPVMQTERRKAGLAEAMEVCSDEEIVNVAGPRFATTMSTWQHLLLRVQQENEGNSKTPLIVRILNEMTSLMAKVSTVANQYLQPRKDDSNTESFQLENPHTARVIGMQCGTYYINKDDHTMLDDRAFLDESLTAVSNDSFSSGAVHMQATGGNQPALKEEYSKNTTDLLQFLEETAPQLRPTGPDEPIVFVGTDTEMLKV